MTPHPEVLQFNGGSLKIRGNAFDNFKNRITDDDVKAICEAAASCPVVSELILPYNNITSAGAMHIAEAFQKGMDTLQTLDLSQNSISEQGGVALMMALKTHSSISTLYLAGNPLGSVCGPPIADVVLSNTCLTSLDLYNTDMDMKALVHIAGALGRNETLLSLSLGKPLLSNPDDLNCVIHHLTLGLQRNKALCDLNLSHFGLADVHLEMILNSLCACNIISLSLKGNKLSQDSGALLAKLLERKESFVSLDVSYNRLRDKGAATLSKSVRDHSRLRFLSLISNSMGTVGIKSSVDAVCCCLTLKTFLIWGNDFSDNVAGQIYDAKDRLEALDVCDVGLYEVGGQPAVYRK